MSTREDFLEDLSCAVDSWVDAAVSATTDPSADLIWSENPEAFRQIQQALAAANVRAEDIRAVFSECFRGLAISTLSIFDGATALAEKTRIRIVDDSGQKVGEGLHNKFAIHWLNTRGDEER